jgi:hypothetical protein
LDRFAFKNNGPFMPSIGAFGAGNDAFVTGFKLQLTWNSTEQVPTGGSLGSFSVDWVADSEYLS